MGETNLDLKGRVYVDFAKIRVNIERMPDGKNKAKAIRLLYELEELTNAPEV